MPIGNGVPGADLPARAEAPLHLAAHPAIAREEAPRARGDGDVLRHLVVQRPDRRDGGVVLEAEPPLEVALPEPIGREIRPPLPIARQVQHLAAEAGEHLLVDPRRGARVDALLRLVELVHQEPRELEALAAEVLRDVRAHVRQRAVRGLRHVGDVLPDAELGRRLQERLPRERPVVSAHRGRLELDRAARIVEVRGERGREAHPAAEHVLAAHRADVELAAREHQRLRQRLRERRQRLGAIALLARLARLGVLDRDGGR